jgi:hypothetical protein
MAALVLPGLDYSYSLHLEYFLRLALRINNHFGNLSVPPLSHESVIKRRFILIYQIKTKEGRNEN